MTLNAYGREATDRLILPIARLMVRAGVTANWLTFSGTMGAFIGVAVVLAGQPVAGAVVLAFATAVDAFDGAVARIRGSQSAFGSFYDSVADRISDAAIFGAVAWLVRDDPLLFGVAIVALTGAQITSYIRAKAESLGKNATVGILERAERIIIIVLAIGFGLVPIALWVLAIGTLVTIAQRFRAVLRQVRTT
ncbi:MAG: CDP-alcohol phosphatidyltransferase family protein [Nitriliruptorales bacterium]|nr:CDP-alcohol phosphatidyltransferase family protein [Nitriliruptorales bacterium]